MVDRPLNEAELVERARRGDLEAWETLVRRYQGIAFRTAYVLAGNAAAERRIETASITPDKPAKETVTVAKTTASVLKCYGRGASFPAGDHACIDRARARMTRSFERAELRVCFGPADGEAVTGQQPDPGGRVAAEPEGGRPLALAGGLHPTSRADCGGTLGRCANRR